MRIKLLLKEQEQVKPTSEITPVTTEEFYNFLNTNYDIKKIEDAFHKTDDFYKKFMNDELQNINLFINKLFQFINSSLNSKILNKQMNDNFFQNLDNKITDEYKELIISLFLKDENDYQQAISDIRDILYWIILPTIFDIKEAPQLNQHNTEIVNFFSSVNSKINYFIEDAIPFYKESTLGRLFGSDSSDTDKLVNLFKSILEFIFINLQNLSSKKQNMLGIVVSKLQTPEQQTQDNATDTDGQKKEGGAKIGSFEKIKQPITVTIEPEKYNNLSPEDKKNFYNVFKSMGLLKEYREHIQQLMPYMQKQIGFNRPPIINFVEDEQNAQNPLGKTGYYNPSTMEITIFVTGRHPKDIMRSVAHEMVHHAQNCRGDLNVDKVGEAGEGYAQTNGHLRNMEKEAYLLGNMMFRDWEDNYKKHNIGLNNMNKKQLNEMHDCNKVHPNKSHAAYKRDDEAKEEKSLDEWRNEERWDLLMKRFNIVSEKRFANDKELDNDGDGKPKWADKDDKNPKVGKREDRKVSDATVKKAHEIGKKIAKSDNVDEPYAVGMSVAKKLSKKGK